jgi:phospholipase C
MPAQIETLIVLMMENRSFDHMLGFMKSLAYPIDGLNADEVNHDSTGEPVKVDNSAAYSGDLSTDPSHDFEDVMEQMFGVRAPGPNQQPDMSGFVRNYERFTGRVSDAHDIMKCFDPARLSILTTLAREYALCDRWFASVPGSTLPNRLYVHAGTSRGRLDLSPDFIGGFRTIYEILWNNNVESALFYHDWSSALTFDFLLKHENQLYATFNRFVELCRKNRLPPYCFIEPRYNSQNNAGAFLTANDQHPDHDVRAGELLIQRVYQAIRSNDDLWKSCMLVIIYDEHGGIYDHVPPQRTISPDGIPCPSPSFNFDWLGPRVPAVIVSPYIRPGTIIHTNPQGNLLTFDHTSVVATAMKLFAPAAWPSNLLGARAQQAQTFEWVADLNMAPRMEQLVFPDPAAAPAVMPAMDAAAAAPAPLSSLQREAVAQAALLEQQLPPDRRTGIDPNTIVDEDKAGQYLSLVADELVKGI